MPGEADDSDPDDGFCAIPAEDAVMAGRKRRLNFQQLTNKDDIDKDELAAPPRKGGKSIISAKADDSVATLPGITSGGSKSAVDKDKLAAPPRKGGKSIIPAMRDEDLATLPVCTWEGNKPIDPYGGRFVAVRETGSNAPEFTDEHNPRPSRLSADEVPVGNKFPYKESITQEYQASDEVDNQASGDARAHSPSRHLVFRRAAA